MPLVYLCGMTLGVPIRNIVDEYIIEMGYDSRHNYSRLLNMAIRGLKELHYDVTGAPSIVQLELDDNQTAPIPKGFISIVRMMINDPQHGLLEMTTDPRMPPRVITQNDGEDVDVPQPRETQDFLRDAVDLGSTIAGARYFRQNTFVGGVFKGVDPNPFTYRINHDTNRFEFSSIVSEPILEYMTDPQVINGERSVPEFAADTLMYWLHHADGRFKKTISPREKQFNQQRYVASKNHLGMRLAEVTYGNMRAARSRHYNLTSPK